MVNFFSWCYLISRPMFRIIRHTRHVETWGELSSQEFAQATTQATDMATEHCQNLIRPAE
jgi:hypothetical protein